MSDGGELEIKEIKDGVSIPVVVAPRASKTKVMGVHGGALKIRLAAPPVDGEANAELIVFFAKLLKVAKSSVEITAGKASKRKVVTVRGARAGEIENKVAQILGG